MLDKYSPEIADQAQVLYRSLTVAARKLLLSRAREQAVRYAELCNLVLVWLRILRAHVRGSGPDKLLQGDSEATGTSR